MDDAAFLMKNASSVIIVPGYGMVVAQVTTCAKEMVDSLKNGVILCNPPSCRKNAGHMNVLLAEANALMMRFLNLRI